MSDSITVKDFNKEQSSILVTDDSTTHNGVLGSEDPAMVSKAWADYKRGDSVSFGDAYYTALRKEITMEKASSDKKRVIHDIEAAYRVVLAEPKQRMRGPGEQFGIYRNGRHVTDIQLGIPFSLEELSYKVAQALEIPNQFPPVWEISVSPEAQQLMSRFRYEVRNKILGPTSTDNLQRYEITLEGGPDYKDLNRAVYITKVRGSEQHVKIVAIEKDRDAETLYFDLKAGTISEESP